MLEVKVKIRGKYKWLIQILNPKPQNQAILWFGAAVEAVCPEDQANGISSQRKGAWLTGTQRGIIADGAVAGRWRAE